MTARRVLPVALAVAVVIGVLLTVGTEPFVHGLTSLSPGAIVAAVLLTAISTAAAATRWRTVATSLGLRLTWGEAVAACYRSQFLNSVLPGGVVGDVHRAYRHGHGSGELAMAARAVATERAAGQVVQFILAAAVLGSLGLTGALGGTAWLFGVLAGVTVAAMAVAALTAPGRRMLRREWGAVRGVFFDPRRAAVIVGTSVVVVASLSGIIVIACLSVGVETSPADLIAFALIALSAASLPINVGGWGPREAAAASTFALLGLGAGAGVAASTAFGVLSLIAVVPGAVVVIVDRAAPPSTRISEESPA